LNEALRWWLVLQVTAILLLPLCLALFARLPDRGYALSKPFALLLLGYAFWLLNSLRILPNSPRGIIIALVLLTLVSGVFARARRGELLAWLEEHATYMLGVELLLFFSFLFFVWLRSFNGSILGTEQPMDLMFLNAATQAEHFPPKDPWLSGHTVAYYYFGYLIVAMVGQLAGVATEIGYNLGLAMTAALALTGAFGLVYNLVAMREATVERAPAVPKPPPGRSRRAARDVAAAAPTSEDRTTGSTGTLGFTNWRPPVFALAGGLMLVVMGNLVFVFHFLSAYGFGSAGFYNWLRIDGLSADEGRESWYPSDAFAYFNASRIIPESIAQSAEQGGAVVTGRVITEFPMFSFLLGDLHPHVMALPFVLLAAAAALTLYRSREPLDITFWLQRPLALVGVALIAGGLAFLNTWDFATLAFVISAAALLRNFADFREQLILPAADSTRAELRSIGVQLTPAGIGVGVIGVLLIGPLWLAAPQFLMLAALLIGGFVLIGLWIIYVSFEGWPWQVEVVARTVSFVVPMVLLAIDAYLPFYSGFSSQASGLGAVVANTNVTEPGTRPVHLLIFWLPLFAVVIPFCLARILAARERITTSAAALACAPAALVVLGWALLFGWQNIRNSNKLEGAAGLFSQIDERGAGWLTALILATLLSAALLALWAELTAGDGEDEREGVVFTLGLSATALLLILGTEFFYVGDIFNSRMNTVFKLYYQAWLLLSVAGGFSLYYLASRWRFTFSREAVFRAGWASLVGIMLAGAALYTVGGTLNRTEGFDATGDLSGLHWMPADEQAAFAWLRKQADGQKLVIAEAVGGDYTETARVSAATGLPTILGWGGHEDQWRGSVAPRVGRFEDVNNMYLAPDLAQARVILEKYDVTYVYVGSVERSKYSDAPLAKFQELPVAFTSGSVTIYRAKGIAGEVTAAP
jgi:YYY domain-containing protein